MLTKEKAQKWAKEIQSGSGVYTNIHDYLDRKGAGSIAKNLIKKGDSVFSYGVEYGILIAVEKIFRK